MISTNVKLLFFAIVTLTFNHHVSCGPLKIMGTLAASSNTNYSAYRNVASLRQFPITEEDLDTDRIVGGQYAQDGQFPFMAVVHRLMGNGLVSQCGGTIISPRWVLTAGHCVSKNPHQFFVLFGTIDKSGMGYNFYQGNGIAMMTYQSYLHPDYSPSLNDVGLLYMPRNIPFGPNIQPIHLAGNNEIGMSFANRKGIVVGWGKDGPIGVGTNVLKYATIPIISNSECSLYWLVTETKHVCTAPGFGQDACQGDSGGPLFVLENDVPVQIGIVSYGDANCPSNKPGVFSNVAGYIDWIEEITGLNF